MATERIVSLLNQLSSIAFEEATRQISLVANADEEVKKLTTNLRAIKAVLVDAEQREVREQTVKVWLDDVKDISYVMEDVLDEWNTEIIKLQIKGEEVHESGEHHLANTMKKTAHKLLSSAQKVCTSLFFHKGIAGKIEEINKTLSGIVERKNNFNFCETRSNEKSAIGERETTSFVNVSEIFGRESDKKTLVKKLLSESSNPQQNLSVISIVGMGGIGKTALAQLVYHDEEITGKFDKKIWVCVSVPFDISKIAKAILESFGKQLANSSSYDLLLGEVKNSMGNNKFLLVLDDVWIERDREWLQLHNCLKCGPPGSKILVTTRKVEVARTMESYSSDILNIKGLSNDECWSLFRKIAFFDRPYEECKDLEEIGKKIVDKCKGFPLAVNTMGSLLRNKKTKEVWQLIFDDEMWKLETFETDIFRPLLLSYNDLPPPVRSCFSYCAIFPKDWEIDRNELIQLWMAQGYLSPNQNGNMYLIGKQYFDLLASRFFFQEFKKDKRDDYNIKCKMHDIVHDVALYISQNECLAIGDNDFENLSINLSFDKIRHLMLTITRLKNYPSLSVLKKLRSLLIHDNMESMGNDQFLLDMEQLTRLRALRLDCGLVKEIPGGIRKLIHLRFLHLIITTQMIVLPGTLCELYNLQTLRVDDKSPVTGYCAKRLPLGMEKLIKLRHLLIYGFRGLGCLPKGIEKLSGLQTLTHFIVSEKCDDSEACTLEALKNLNQLRGSLHIEGLGYVKDASEIKKAELWNKENLVELHLEFSRYRGGDNHEKLLKAFEPPPPNLKALKIYKFEGNIVSPNWMKSLSTLKKLVLSRCEKWVRLPPFGNWQHLESLEIEIMENILTVSSGFFGVESVGASSSSSSSSSKIPIFPKLKSLRFYFMTSWIRWNYGNIRKDEEQNTIMPQLQSLKFQDCPKLRELPEELFRRTTLEELELEGNSSQSLKERYEEWSNRRKALRLSTSN